MKLLSGVITALLTPTKVNGTINLEESVKLANYCIDNGVNGLFVCGTNGEGIKYTVSQRKELAKAVVKGVNKNKAMVCIHTGTARLEETIELTQHAHLIGADCAAVISPSFLAYNDDELFEYYSSVLKNSPNGFPVYLYNMPQRTGNDISVELCKRLFLEYSNLAGVKYSFNDIERTMAYLDINGFSVLHGYDVYQLQFLSMGCSGVVSGLSGIYPVPFAKVWECWNKGDIKTAQQWQKIGYEVCKISSFGNIAVMKQISKIKGFDFHCNNKIGVQYPDMILDGDDLIWVQRTAMNSAENFHNSNYITFHRLENFRSYIV